MQEQSKPAVAVERRGSVWVSALGAWVPEAWMIAGLALSSDGAAKARAGWERVEGGWIVESRPMPRPLGDAAPTGDAKRGGGGR